MLSDTFSRQGWTPKKLKYALVLHIGQPVRPIGRTGQAKVLNDNELKMVLKIIDSGHHAKRNTAIVILSHYLGLRSKELASLKISDVV